MPALYVSVPSAARAPAPWPIRYSRQDPRRHDFQRESPTCVGASAYNRTIAMADIPSVIRSLDHRWTGARIARLARRDLTQLRANAADLGDAKVVALCDHALLTAPRGPGSDIARRLKASGVRLVSRRSAFEARGVTLQALSSWGGIRGTDGTVVLSIWKDAIESALGVCSYLLWAPNRNGARPWSDTPAGRERLEHCRQAATLGAAEALLVYGEPLAGHIPEDKATTISGVDAVIVLQVEVVLRGEEYWAVWGRRRTGVAASL
jgi:hypothetical protein